MTVNFKNLNVQLDFTSSQTQESHQKLHETVHYDCVCCTLQLLITFTLQIV
jgi:hypothetical protein